MLVLCIMWSNSMLHCAWLVEENRMNCNRNSLAKFHISASSVNYWYSLIIIDSYYDIFLIPWRAGRPNRLTRQGIIKMPLYTSQTMIPNMYISKRPQWVGFWDYLIWRLLFFLSCALFMSTLGHVFFLLTGMITWSAYKYLHNIFNSIHNAGYECQRQYHTPVNF